jgi:hypothetical protein
MTPFQKKIILFLILFCFSYPAWAKMISGKISASDSSTRKITISTADASGRSTSVDVWVDTNASLSGIQSVGELKAGQQIWAEASEDAEGNLRASSLSKST